MATFKALKNFPYSVDGIKNIQLGVGDTVETDPKRVAALVKHGYLEEVSSATTEEEIKQPKSAGGAPQNKMEEGAPSDKDDKQGKKDKGK